MDTKLMQVSCDPQCGFMARDHNDNELIEIVKMHVKKTHNKDVTDQEVRNMMKPA